MARHDGSHPDVRAIPTGSLQSRVAAMVYAAPAAIDGSGQGRTERTTMDLGWIDGWMIVAHLLDSTAVSPWSSPRQAAIRTVCSRAGRSPRWGTLGRRREILPDHGADLLDAEDALRLRRPLALSVTSQLPPDRVLIGRWKAQLEPSICRERLAPFQSHQRADGHQIAA